MGRERSTSIQRAAAQWCESLAGAGVTHVGKMPKTRPASEKPAPENAKSSRPAANTAPPAVKSVESTAPATPVGRMAFAPVAAASAVSTPPTSASPRERLTLSGSAGDPWEALRLEVAACVRCQELASTRTQTVFGVGNRRAQLCFMGEAPGADEDKRGEPFVGAAGQLLTKIIEACGMKREDVYILNTLKCRPPGNRTPAPDEVSNCRDFLDRQLKLLQPEYLCCLGAVAAQSLLGTTTPIGKLRGRLHAVKGMQVLCTYHPAYLLRNPAAKRDVWQDMKLLLAAMGRPVN
jgi:DNA polymerase